MPPAVSDEIDNPILIERRWGSMRPFALGLTAIVAAGLAAAAWIFFEGPPRPLAPRPQITEQPHPQRLITAEELTAARRSVEAQLQAIPEFVPFFGKLHDHFPADYDRVLDIFADRLATTGTAEGPDVYLSEAYRMLRQTRGIVAAKASPEALAHIFEAEAALLKALGDTDPHLCVDFLYGGATQSYFGFSAKHRQLVAELALADLDAIIDGNVRHIERAKPTDADFDGLEKALREKGLNEAEIGALIDGKTPDPPIEDGRMCAADRLEFEALKGLPDEERSRIYGLEVELMARS